MNEAKRIVAPVAFIARRDHRSPLSTWSGGTVAQGPTTRKEATVTEAAQETLRSSEAAARLGVHPNTLASWADKGWLHSIALPSGEVRFAEDEVDALRARIYAS